MEENVKVLNYTPSVIAVARSRNNGDSVAIQGAEEGMPGFEYFTQREIEYINSVSPVFKLGALEFEPEVEEAMYKKLSLLNWKETCLFERDIVQMILHPTYEAVRRVLAIRDVMTMERVRGNLAELIRQGRDVSVKMQTIIEKRYEEIKRGRMNSAIEVEKVRGETEKASARDEVAELRQQLDTVMKLLQRQGLQQSVVSVPNADGNILTAATPTVTAASASYAAPSVSASDTSASKQNNRRGRKPAPKK